MLYAFKKLTFIETFQRHFWNVEKYAQLHDKQMRQRITVSLGM